MQSAKVKLLVSQAPIIKEIVVNTGEKTLSNLKAILHIEHISLLYKSYENFADLVVCEVYDDSAQLVYESALTLLDMKTDLASCEARCSSIASPSKSF